MHIASGRSVALKRILMHNETEGAPITALREIRILKTLTHENVVRLLDVLVVRGAPRFRHCAWVRWCSRCADVRAQGAAR